MIKLYSRVNSPFGYGILISINTSFNGLYVDYERATCVIWYGMNNPGSNEDITGSFVSMEFSLKELLKFNNEKEISISFE